MPEFGQEQQSSLKKSDGVLGVGLTPWLFFPRFALFSSFISWHASLIGKSFGGFLAEASCMMLCVELGILKTRNADLGRGECWIPLSRVCG